MIEFEMDEEYKYIISICNFLINDSGYINITATEKNYEILRLEKGREYYLHRVLWSLKNNQQILDGEQIDHINRDKMDNRTFNLRKVSNEQNAKNRSIAEKQSYYNIYYDQYQNNFRFSYKKYGIVRKFLNLRSALNYFDYVDKKYDYELSKHISDFIPTSMIKDVWLTKYDYACGLCDRTFWSEFSFDKHVGRCEGNLRKIDFETLKRSKIIIKEFD